MNVSLTQDLEQYINTKVATGMYRSASEVVREGLRLLKGVTRCTNSDLVRCVGRLRKVSTNSTEVSEFQPSG
ncbi:MAG: type II toxin-antitoxin system ParD family antitoxin [Blastocatellia bacterium]|nr:type II toxin-antitoxin system ParD family antitoxin [Blastocatellia bacterium]